MTNEEKLEWLMDRISIGKARIEGREYCTDGMRYSKPRNGWVHLFNIIYPNRPGDGE